ncbi:MAG TPA: BMP family ABC transporter substrate-binding protein [Chthonomonadaceae bacterium]|nr:BMP family ABC transporter substrate-binding protein [Chthonomonadaceae bacterium]
MRTITRRTLLGLGAALAAVGLAGCPGPPEENKGAETPGSSGAPATPGTNGGAATTDKSGKKIKVALVFDLGGPDDKSFNASANNGLMKAKADLGLSDADVKTVESKNAADYKINMTNFATQNFDLIIAVGFNMANAMKEVAPQFPNVKFAIVDADAPEGAANCVGLKFQEEQGSFLAGFLAASMSKTKKIGFVGGMEGPLIGKFEAGYRAGAKTAGFDPDKQVSVTYTGTWDDLSKGKDQANQQFGNGADIIYQAAGKAGLGVIQAAQDKGKGFYAIGVDQDQDYIAPGRVLTSMVKHVDLAVADTIERVQKGTFVSGTKVYSLKDGAIGLSEMKYTKQDIPADVLAKLDKLTKMVADGEVVPPTKPADVAAFTPPKL